MVGTQLGTNLNVVGMVLGPLAAGVIDGILRITGNG
jgi:hypothetical protein